MSRSTKALVKLLVSVPVGGALGYAFCHEPFLGLLFVIHGVLLGPLAVIAAGTFKIWVIALFFLGTTSYVLTECAFVFRFHRDLTPGLLLLNALLFVLALAAEILSRKLNKM